MSRASITIGTGTNTRATLVGGSDFETKEKKRNLQEREEKREGGTITRGEKEKKNRAQRKHILRILSILPGREGGKREAALRQGK